MFKNYWSYEMQNYKQDALSFLYQLSTAVPLSYHHH